MAENILMDSVCMSTQYSARTPDVDKIRAAQDVLVCKIRVNQRYIGDISMKINRTDETIFLKT